MKTLSIIVPSYNMEKFISRCLDSFIAPQLSSKLEVIIVNDGSKDLTLEIAEKYQNQYPDTFIVVDKPNGGHGSTINKGIDMATAKYFKVVDADDWVDTNALIKLVDALENSDVDVVVTGYNTVTAGDASVNGFRFDNVEFNRAYSFKEIVDIGIVIPMHSIAYKTSILKENNIRLQEGTFYVDIEYNLLTVPYVKSIAFLDIMLYQYFLGRPDQSVSRNSLLRNYDHTIRVDKRIIRFYTDTQMDEYQAKYYKSYLLRLIKNHYYALPNLPDTPKNNFMRCKEYDVMIKELSPQLYKCVEDWYIWIVRRSNFKAVRLFTILQPIWSYKIKRFFKVCK